MCVEKERIEGCVCVEENGRVCVLRRRGRKVGVCWRGVRKMVSRRNMKEREEVKKGKVMCEKGQRNVERGVDRRGMRKEMRRGRRER